MSSTTRQRRRSGTQSRSQQQRGVATVDGSAHDVKRGLVTHRIRPVLRVESMATKYKDNIIASTRHREKRANDMRPRAARFRVSYMYGKEERGAAQTRTRLTTSTSNLWNPQTRSETGVLAYLRGRHPGYEITILDLEFQSSSGEPM